MNIQEKWILFLQKHPEYTSIVKMRLFMQVLSFTKNQARTIKDLALEFSGYEYKDLEKVVEILLSLKLIDSINVLGKDHFKANKNGKELLDKYFRAREEFKTE